MRLSPQELSEVLAILEKIDRGEVEPKIPGRMGRYLRQYRGGRAQIDQVLATRGVKVRADAAASGRTLGPIEAYPILDPEVGLLSFPLGEVAQTVAISETLGGLTNLVLWLKGPVANGTYNLLRENPGIRFSGDYRWSPPARLTPGEATIERCDNQLGWQDARCLKAVAEDLIRPPHALEYVLDFRLGAPGLKYFRCVCARRCEEQWEVLPALSQPRLLAVEGSLPKAVTRLKASDIASLLIYREPWSDTWTIVRAHPVDAQLAVGHAIAWADFQREVHGSEMNGSIVAGIRDSLRAIGVNAADGLETNLTRQLLPLARDVLRLLRGSG